MKIIIITIGTDAIIVFGIVYRYYIYIWTSYATVIYIGIYVRAYKEVQSEIDLELPNSPM